MIPRARTTNQNFTKIDIWEFPNLVVSNLVVCTFYAETLFCALLHPFASSFADFCVCAHLRSVACICVFLRTTAFATTTFGNCRNIGKKLKRDQNRNHFLHTEGQVGTAPSLHAIHSKQSHGCHCGCSSTIGPSKITQLIPQEFSGVTEVTLLRQFPENMWV